MATLGIPVVRLVAATSPQQSSSASCGVSARWTTTNRAREAGLAVCSTPLVQLCDMFPELYNLPGVPRTGDQLTRALSEIDGQGDRVREFGSFLARVEGRQPGHWRLLPALHARCPARGGALRSPLDRHPLVHGPCHIPHDGRPPFALLVGEAVAHANLHREDGHALGLS